MVLQDTTKWSYRIRQSGPTGYDTVVLPVWRLVVTAEGTFQRPHRRGRSEPHIPMWWVKFITYGAVPLNKLLVSQLVVKLPEFYRTWIFITGRRPEPYEFTAHPLGLIHMNSFHTLSARFTWITSHPFGLITWIHYTPFQPDHINSLHTLSAYFSILPYNV